MARLLALFIFLISGYSICNVLNARIKTELLVARINRGTQRQSCQSNLLSITAAFLKIQHKKEAKMKYNCVHPDSDRTNVSVCS